MSELASQNPVKPQLNLECCKCGCSQPRLLYLPPPVDMIRICCQVCGYDWTELPVDSPLRLAQQAKATVTPLRPVPDVLTQKNPMFTELQKKD